MIYPRVLAALLLSGGMASVAVAAPPVMLNDALITQISKADRASFHEAVAQALNSSADGQSTANGKARTSPSVRRRSRCS